MGHWIRHCWVRTVAAGGLLAVTLAGWAAPARMPQAPHLRVLNVDDGLPATALSAIARDRAGFVWLGSADGLARYDGSRFRIWRHEPADARSLPGNIVQALHVDSRDRVWVASEFGGVSMLDAQRVNFAIMNQKTHPALGSNDVFAITSQGDTLWLGTSGSGLYRVDVAANDPVRWRPEPIAGLAGETVMALESDAAGHLWIGTLQGLARWDGQQLVRERPGKDGETGMVYSLAHDGHSGQLWVGTARGVFRRDRHGHWSQPSWSPMFERPNAMTALACGPDGELWIGSQRRLWHVPAGGDIPVPVESEDSRTQSSVQALYLQPEGGLWTAVPGAGLGFLRADWRSVVELGARRLDDLRGGAYRGLGPARSGGIWAAGNDGHIERITAEGVVARMGDAVRARLLGTKPYAVVEDRLGQLWLGDSRLGLTRIGMQGEVRQWGRTGEAPLPAGNLVDLLLLGADDTLWLSVQGGGLQQRDIHSGKVLRTLPPGQASGLGDGDSEAMRLAPDGTLWVAGGFGLGWLDESGQRIHTPPALAGERVFSFAFAGHDALWLHRLGGLEHYRRENGQWRRRGEVREGQDLPAVESGGMQVDRDGRVWLSTRRGLLRWDPARGHVRHYGLANGLGSQEFLDRSMTMTDDGILALGSNIGTVVMVDTRYPEPPARQALLRLDGVDVRRDGRWLPQGENAQLRFLPEDREIRLTGHLVDYENPQAVRYWSHLKGFDNGWVEQGSNGERVFTGLKPGHYVLQMRARDAAGNASAVVAREFEVLAPWWRSKWAYAAYVSLLAALGWWLVRQWRQRLARQHEWQLAEQRRHLAEQASEAKTRFLANLGHELRTPMTGVLGMAELLHGSVLDAGQRAQVSAIRQAGQHLLHLVNDALDLARVEAGRLELAEAPLDIVRISHDVAVLLRPLAESKGLALRVQVAPAMPHGFLGDATRIEQILLNLLGNAIKFTEQGEVCLELAPGEPQGVRLAVRDTGPGMSAQASQRIFGRFEQGDDSRTRQRHGGSGLGLAISRELAQAMGGDIRLHSQPGQGSCFTVYLPLPAATLQPSVPPEADRPDTAAGLSLLLVEDDATVAEVVTGLLRQQGHRVAHAGHGLAALVAAAAQRFDAALLDLDLPGMDGFELARQLRANGADWPMLAITARADREAETLAQAAGFAGFIRKPVTGEMLQHYLAPFAGGQGAG